MWSRMALGAVFGLVVGHFTPPGYALWLILGVTAGHVAEVWAGIARERAHDRVEV